MNPKLKDRARQKLLTVDANGTLLSKPVERWQAHSSPGIKHLAVAVLVFDPHNKLILQHRSAAKVGGGVWDYPTTHVLVGETPEQATWRCLKEEYGLPAVMLTPLFGFSYEHDYQDGTCENEYLLMYRATAEVVRPNPKEVSEVTRRSLADVVQDVSLHPESYTVWFRHTMTRFLQTPQGKRLLR